MMTFDQYSSGPQPSPLVSILTPVYNGELYLRECIESVLSQTYRNWEYYIVNNCSTDRTMQLAKEYAAKDNRIHIIDSATFLPAIANHNRAFKYVSAESKYCKVLSADDIIFPLCIEQMVSVAEKHPSVGVIGSYQISGADTEWHVRNDGLSYMTERISGTEICRANLLGIKSIFGNPTSTLYRSDLVRAAAKFFPNEADEADESALYECLKVSDYGFVHQVLSYERSHPTRLTNKAIEYNTRLSAKISDCAIYGGLYLTPRERELRIKSLLDEYYKYLVISIFTRRNKAFWAYHSSRLDEIGYPMNKMRLLKSVIRKMIDLLLSPKKAVRLSISVARRGRI